MFSGVGPCWAEVHIIDGAHAGCKGFMDAPPGGLPLTALTNGAASGVVTVFDGRIKLTVERVKIGDNPPTAYAKIARDISAVQFEPLRERRHFPRVTPRTQEKGIAL
jgi:hypothetical protein